MDIRLRAMLGITALASTFALVAFEPFTHAGHAALPPDELRISAAEDGSTEPPAERDDADLDVLLAAAAMGVIPPVPGHEPIRKIIWVPSLEPDAHTDAPASDAPPVPPANTTAHAPAVKAPRPKHKPTNAAGILERYLARAETEGFILDKHETRCIAHNLYEEANDQPDEGSYAVAEVTVNLKEEVAAKRAKATKTGARTIKTGAKATKVGAKAITKDAGGITKDAGGITFCQLIYIPYKFSWTLNPKKVNRKTFPDLHAYERSVQHAVLAQTGRLKKTCASKATHYYDPFRASPDWAPKMNYLCTIGDHRFYN